MDPNGYFARIIHGAFFAAFIGIATRSWHFGIAALFASFLVDMWVENVVEAIKSIKK